MCCLKIERVELPRVQSENAVFKNVGKRHGYSCESKGMGTGTSECYFTEVDPFLSGFYSGCASKICVAVLLVLVFILWLVPI